MNSKDFKAKLSTGTLTRRQVNKMLASVGIISASMSGFGRSALAAADPSLLVFTWSTYDKPNLHPTFIEQHGSSPGFTLFTSNGEARAKVRSGFQPDLAAPSWSHASFWMSEGLVEPIDTSRLDHWPELFDKMHSLEPGDVKHYIPWSWGNTAVVYRTDLAPQYIDNPTWGILWDEELKGKIAVRDAIMGAVVPAGLFAGVKDAFNMTDEDLEVVGALMRKQRDLVKFYWKGEADVQQALASGEIIAATGWNSTYATLKKQGVPVGFMVPKEGMPTWVDGYMMIKGGPAPEQEKYDFLDAVMTPEAGALIIEELGYGAANKLSWDIADPESIATLGIGDVNTAIRESLWSVAVPTEIKNKMVDLLNRVKAGF